jgi:transcriptional regulator with XRE-family HTH domain
MASQGEDQEMTSADAQQERARRPAAGIPIDGIYLEHLRNMREMSRAQVAELVGLQLFDRKLFSRVLDGTEPLDATTLRVMTKVLGCSPPLQDGGDGPAALIDSAVLDTYLDKRGWTREVLAEKVARAWRSRDSMAKIENGERNPTPGTLGALCAVLSTPDHMVEPGELITGSSPRSAAREAAAKRAREAYYTGLRAFVVGRGEARLMEEITFTAEQRQAYDRYLLDGGDPAVDRAAS